MKRVPELKTDAEAEAFLEQDLSGLDLKQFKPMRLEVVKKEASMNLLPMYGVRKQGCRYKKTRLVYGVRKHCLPS